MRSLFVEILLEKETRLQNGRDTAVTAERASSEGNEQFLYTFVLFL